MSKEAIELFKKCIKGTFYLKRENRSWLLHEDYCEIELKTPNGYSFGLRLGTVSPCNFFSDSPPPGIGKMCDAVIALSLKSELYIFIIEQKTSYKEDYKKQLANGKYLCDWLLALLKEYDHYDGNPVFIGLLCWRPRERSPYKGTTGHRDDVVKTQHELFEGGLYIIRNRKEVRLMELINS